MLPCSDSHFGKCGLQPSRTGSARIGSRTSSVDSCRALPRFSRSWSTIHSLIIRHATYVHCCMTTHSRTQKKDDKLAGGGRDVW